MALQHLRDERERACWDWLAGHIGSDTFQSADVEERGDMYPDFGRLLQAAYLRHPKKEDSVKAIGYALRHATGKRFGGKTLMSHGRDADGAVWTFHDDVTMGL